MLGRMGRHCLSPSAAIVVAVCGLNFVSATNKRHPTTSTLLSQEHVLRCPMDSTATLLQARLLARLKAVAPAGPVADAPRFQHVDWIPKPVLPEAVQPPTHRSRAIAACPHERMPDVAKMLVSRGGAREARTHAPGGSYGRAAVASVPHRCVMESPMAVRPPPRRSASVDTCASCSRVKVKFVVTHATLVIQTSAPMSTPLSAPLCQAERSTPGSNRLRRNKIGRCFATRVLPPLGAGCTRRSSVAG
jgi:hypothetical protein